MIRPLKKRLVFAEKMFLLHEVFALEGMIGLKRSQSWVTQAVIHVNASACAH